MIQRRQTLFLIQVLFLSIILLFTSLNTVITAKAHTNVSLLPLSDATLVSTGSHWVAIGVNFLIMLLSLVTIFLYKKRELQRNMCFVLAALWLVLTIIIIAFPFVLVTSSEVVVEPNYIGWVVGVVAIAAALFAARLIKKDIDLLKSADRIR